MLIWLAGGSWLVFVLSEAEPSKSSSVLVVVSPIFSNFYSHGTLS